MKAEDMLLAGLTFGAIVMMGLAYRKTVEARSLSSAAVAGSMPGAGGPYAGGSYFTPEQQAVWAVPDAQLPAWGEL